MITGTRDVALDLLDEHERDDDPERRERRVEGGHEGGRHRRQDGAEIRDGLHEARPDAEEERVAGPRREGADHAKEAHREAHAAAEGRGQQHLRLDVVDQRRQERHHGDEADVDPEDAQVAAPVHAFKTLHERVQHQGDEAGHRRPRSSRPEGAGFRPRRDRASS